MPLLTTSTSTDHRVVSSSVRAQSIAEALGIPFIQMYKSFGAAGAPVTSCQVYHPFFSILLQLFLKYLFPAASLLFLFENLQRPKDQSLLECNLCLNDLIFLSRKRKQER